MTLHPQIIEKEGRKEFVVIPYDEFVTLFVTLRETLEFYEDVTVLREEKNSGGEEPTQSLDSVLEEVR
jgi:hypothetical protein